MRIAWGHVVAAVALAAFVACSSSPSGTPPSTTPPPAAGCAIDEETLADESCQAPGVPPSACGDGFKSDAAGGCDAILPADACAAGTLAIPGETTCRVVGVVEPPMCAAGQMAVVGETACRAVADCGAAPWGAIPVDATTTYVDASFTGTSDGSAASPFKTIQAGIDAAASSAIVAIAAGSYAESVVVMAKPVKLWGRCPSMVEIATSGGNAALTFTGVAAAMSEAHQIAMTGDGYGVRITAGANGVVVDRAWVHATTGEGIFASAAATVRGSLIEGAHTYGVHAESTELLLDASLVRDTHGASDGRFGNGAHALSAATLTVQGSVLERNRDVAVYAETASATVDHSVIRDTLPRDADQKLGAGAGAHLVGSITIKSSRIVRSHAYGVVAVVANAILDDVLIADTQPAASTGLTGTGFFLGTLVANDKASATVTRSLFENNQLYGIFSDGATLDIATSGVRDTQPEMASKFGGVGIQIAHGMSSGIHSKASLRSVLVERNRTGAVGIEASTVTIDSSLFRSTKPDDKGEYGIGLEAEPGSDLTVRTSVIADSALFGIYAAESNVVIDATTVRDTAPEPLTGWSRGIHVQTMTPGSITLSVSRSLVASSKQIGIAIAGAVTKMDHTMVRGTHAPDGAAGGDGIEVWAGATLDADHLRVDDNSRAAIAVFGSHCGLSATALTCAGFSLDGEMDGDASYDYVLDPTVRCGCPGAVDTCQVLSESLLAPKALMR